MFLLLEPIKKIIENKPTLQKRMRPRPEQNKNTTKWKGQRFTSYLISSMNIQFELLQIFWGRNVSSRKKKQ